jgi:hypothetical protein
MDDDGRSSPLPVPPVPPSPRHDQQDEQPPQSTPRMPEIALIHAVEADHAHGHIASAPASQHSPAAPVLLRGHVRPRRPVQAALTSTKPHEQQLQQQPPAQSDQRRTPADMSNAGPAAASTRLVHFDADIAALASARHHSHVSLSRRGSRRGVTPAVSCTVDMSCLVCGVFCHLAGTVCPAQLYAHSLSPSCGRPVHFSPRTAELFR